MLAPVSQAFQASRYAQGNQHGPEEDDGLKKKIEEDGKDKTVSSPLLQGEGSPIPWSRISTSALLMFVYYKSLLEEEQGVICALQDG